jgi:acyl-CoA reductase-like NAD-dependent aldehyde dehydrogenase
MIATAPVESGRRAQAQAACARVRSTLTGQSEGWKKRSLFERQWVLRAFRKMAGMSAEEWLAALTRLESILRSEADPAVPPLPKLAAYYAHLAELAKGCEKDAAKLEESLRHVYRWRDDVVELGKLLE